MVNSPAGRKTQAMIAKLLLSKGFGDGNAKVVAALENIAAGKPASARLLTGDECQRLALAFRLKWIFIHLGFWNIAGWVWIGSQAALGIVPSWIILVLQLNWKKRQLLRSMGYTDAEARQRVSTFQ